MRSGHLKYIDDYAFSGCKFLKKVNLPDGLEYLGGSAFSGCEALDTLEIPMGTKMRVFLQMQTPSYWWYVIDAPVSKCTTLIVKKDPAFMKQIEEYDGKIYPEVTYKVK